MTQLGLMPQIMNIRLQSALSSTTTGAKPDVKFTIAASLRPFATTPPLAPAAPRSRWEVANEQAPWS